MNLSLSKILLSCLAASAFGCAHGGHKCGDKGPNGEAHSCEHHEKSGHNPDAPADGAAVVAPEASISPEAQAAVIEPASKATKAAKKKHKK